jgi:hypothetical protein
MAWCNVWWNPDFLPPSEIAPQMRHLGFTLPTDGSADQELSEAVWV